MTDQGDRRLSLLGEASAIAAVTATAYMVALSYRAAEMYRLTLPISLATVRLSDAVFAGVFVLVGGAIAIVLGDMLESWRTGSVDKIARWTVVLAASALPLTVLLASVAILPALSVSFGWTWAVVIVVAADLVWGYSTWRLVRWLSRFNPKTERLDALARRHPVPTLSVVIAVTLCLCSSMLGISGIGLAGKSYPKTVSTNEIAVAFSEDRVVLEGILPSDSLEATLTGAFRVVALPSADASFSAIRIRHLHPPSGN